MRGPGRQAVYGNNRAGSEFSGALGLLLPAPFSSCGSLFLPLKTYFNFSSVQYFHFLITISSLAMLIISDRKKIIKGNVEKLERKPFTSLKSIKDRN